MRPTYESQSDLVAERVLAERFAKAWSVSVQKLPRSYGVDFAVLRGDRVVGWVEVKNRTNPSTQYADYMISLHKMHAGLGLSMINHCPFVIVVGFTDACMYATHYPTSPLQYKVAFGGREDRNDWQDREPVALIPITTFRKLGA